MNIASIFSKILTAPKITTATIAALGITGFIYILNQKIAVIPDQYLGAGLIIFVLGTFIATMGIIGFIELQKIKAENKHKESMAELKEPKKKAQGINNSQNVVSVDNIKVEKLHIGDKINKQFNIKGNYYGGNKDDDE